MIRDASFSISEENYLDKRNYSEGNYNTKKYFHLIEGNILKLIEINFTSMPV